MPRLSINNRFQSFSLTEIEPLLVDGVLAERVLSAVDIARKQLEFGFLCPFELFLLKLLVLGVAVDVVLMRFPQVLMSVQCRDLN